MALMAISRAISANIQRSVDAAEAKHQDKMDDLKQRLTAQAMLRSTVHATTVIKANVQHKAWFTTLDASDQSDFDRVKAALEAAIVRPAT